MSDVEGALAAFLKPFEGFHRVVTRKPVVTAVPYLCPANFWTIGWGILCDQHHPPITLEEGEVMLLGVLPAYTGHALRLSPRLGREPVGRQVAIGDFVFNLGPTRYAASTLRRCVDAGNWARAAQEILRWVWGGGVRLPGLVLRRQAEANLLLAP